jgi:NAD(P)H dehydrogenase (quinone)
VIVTGANGRLGSAIVEQLLQVSPDSLLAASVRDPNAAERWTELGLDVRHGDFNLPGRLELAFEGAERLLIISTSSPNDVRIVQHRHVIEAARRARVRELYYTSIVQREGSPFLPTAGHLQTETDIRQSGIAATILCNGQYMENLPFFLQLGSEGDTIALPADGGTASVALSDLAEGIARVLTTPGDRREPEIRTLTLTGPEAIDFARLAALASKSLGRPIQRQIIDSSEFIARAVSKGVAPAAARMFESGFRSKATGELARVDPALQKILGRPLRTVEGELPRLLAGLH